MSRNTSSLKTNGTGFKGKHPKYWIKINDLCSMNSQAWRICIWNHQSLKL